MQYLSGADLSFRIPAPLPAATGDNLRAFPGMGSFSGCTHQSLDTWAVVTAI